MDADLTDKKPDRFTTIRVSPRVSPGYWLSITYVSSGYCTSISWVSCRYRPIRSALSQVRGTSCEPKEMGSSPTLYRVALFTKVGHLRLDFFCLQRRASGDENGVLLALAV
jgi:hypothetical protein